MKGLALHSGSHGAAGGHQASRQALINTAPGLGVSGKHAFLERH